MNENKENEKFTPKEPSSIGKIYPKGPIMNNWLVDIDLYGTLLNSYGDVSNENKQAIKLAVDNGVNIVLASGRMPMSVKNLALELNTSRYIICGNGTLVYDIKDNRNIYECFLPKEKVLEIIKLCEDNSIYYNLYTEHEVIAKSINYNILYYNSENSNKPVEKRTNINIIENLYQYVKDTENLNVLKMTICDNDKIIFAGIVRKLKKIAQIDVLEIEHMSKKSIKQGTKAVEIEYYYTEVSSQNADKWSAIEFLIKKLNITKDCVMAIGDNANDKKMVENAGIGVAMGNSMLSANSIGDVVVADNNSNGVAEALNKFLNINNFN